MYVNIKTSIYNIRLLLLVHLKYSETLVLSLLCSVYTALKDILNALLEGYRDRRDVCINIHTAEYASIGVCIPDTIAAFLEQDIAVLLMSFVHQRAFVHAGWQ